MQFIKLNYLSLTLSACMILGHGSLAVASSLPMPLTVNEPGSVLMVDGKDKDMGVDIHIRGGRKLFAQGFDFGFMEESVYTPLQSSWCATGNYQFAGGSTVDFTLRSKGADGIFGSADDDYFRLSDAADFADQFYFGPIDSARSRNPNTNETYYRKLVLVWDLDHDGSRDFSVTLKAGKSSGGMMPSGISSTPVPVPAAAWLFGSGLMGLAAVARRKRRT